MMRLRTLSTGTWTVVAEERNDGTCEVLEELKDLRNDSKTKATGDGFYALWSRIPNEGPRKLGDLFYHQLNAKHDIWEFIKRDHRIICFPAGGRLVVCSHVVLKKRQKIDPADIDRAVEMRRRYLEAEKSGQIKIEGLK